MEAENRVKGMFDYETAEKLDAEFLASFQVNVLGVIHAVNAFLPLLRRGTTKKVVFIGSEAGDCGLVWKIRHAHAAAYGTTTAAANMVTTKYAAELESEGFTVVSVSPGTVDVSGTATAGANHGGTKKIAPTVSNILINIRKAFPKAGTLITPEESGRRLISFIDSASPAESGVFHPSAEYLD